MPPSVPRPAEDELMEMAAVAWQTGYRHATNGLPMSRGRELMPLLVTLGVMSRGQHQIPNLRKSLREVYGTGYRFGLNGDNRRMVHVQDKSACTASRRPARDRDRNGSADQHGDGADGT